MHEKTDRKPLVLVTGFLGAGKTTLLRWLVEDFRQRGKTVDVILNDIENADLDAATIQNDAVRQLDAIAASCACCESLDELVSRCQAAAESASDILLIELNGTADPLSLLESFTLLEERLPFFPLLSICVVDARQWGRRGELTPLETRQAESARLRLLTHTEGVDSAALAEVEGRLQEVAPQSMAVNREQLSELLGRLEAARKKAAGGDLARDLDARQALEGSSPRVGHDAVHALSHMVSGFQIVLPPKVRRLSIERLISKLPSGVLRAKALVRLVEEPGRYWLFERCGQDLPRPLPIPPGLSPSPSLLCVGPRLDREILKGLVIREFGESAVKRANPEW